MLPIVWWLFPVSEALGTLRELARGIYPPLLADQGLTAAVTTQASKAPRPVEVNAGGLGRYPAEIETAIYFCCLEALQNAARHAPASAVRVNLAEDRGQVMFTVTDDGPGFDPAAVAAGSGLRNMSDRLAALGGSCQVDSCPGRGTTVAGRIGLPGPVAAAARRRRRRLRWRRRVPSPPGPAGREQASRPGVASPSQARTGCSVVAFARKGQAQDPRPIRRSASVSQFGDACGPITLRNSLSPAGRTFRNRCSRNPDFLTG